MFDYELTCPRCDATYIDCALNTPTVCTACKDADRKPQGETVRLFEPAPTHLPGQLAF